MFYFVNLIANYINLIAFICKIELIGTKLISNATRYRDVQR